MTLEIPYKKLNSESLNAHCEIMRKGNTVLRKCADMTGMEYRKFRITLFKKRFDPRDHPDLKQDQIIEITKALPLIDAVRNIEWNMVCAFSQLVRQRAERWASRSNGIISYEDFEQEAFMALIDSIYSYTRSDVCFSTFAHWAIEKRMMTAANKNCPFCPWTNQAMKLMKRYNKARRTQEVIGPMSQEDLIVSLNVTDEEAQIIRDCLVMVAVPSQYANPDIENNDSNDYSEGRRNIDRERCEPIPADYQFRSFSGSVPLNADLRRAIAEADLSDLELKVLETSLSPHYGWQEELASETINPRTLRRYTRQAINVILQAAIKKVKEVYLKGQDKVA